MRRTLLLVSASAIAFVACVPKRDYPADQISKLTKLDDIMDVQATIADPQFKKIEQATYTESDWAAFVDVGARLQLTSTRTKEFSKGPGFDALASQLNQHASALATAASAKESGSASKALADIRATCKECHSKFR